MLQSLFSKVASLAVYKFIKKGLQHRCFPVNIAKKLMAYIFNLILCVSAMYFFIFFAISFAEVIKENAQFIFSVTPQNNRLMFAS